MADFRTLNKKQDYGTVHGVGVTHAFEQNGFCYDHTGKLMEELLDEAGKKRLAEIEARAAAKEAARKAETAALKKAGLEPEAEKSPTRPATKTASASVAPPGNDSGDDDELDLKGWYRGTVKYRFGEVQAEIERKYSIFVSDEAAARQAVAGEEGLSD